MEARVGSPSAPGGSTGRPSGTVTFLFSDIEGSTRRWERASEAMAVALRRHDELLRSVIERNGGYVFKTVGDAFCAAFTNANNALQAATDGQRAVLEEDWSRVDGLQVRMALHTGVPEEERDSDYFGQAVNRVARLLAVGNGGQILVSAATAALVDVSTGAFRLLDLGEHRLKDLSRPERIWQVVAEGLPAQFPTLNSLDARPNNLPYDYTTFVGREAEQRELLELLGRSRLVTVIGTGGMGKTRLALRVAANASERFEGGVWFVTLAAVGESRLVPTVIAEVLGVASGAAHDPVDKICAHIGDQRYLLLLDNAEHLIDGVAQTIDILLRRCAGLHALVTSREPLELAGETILRLSPLPLPEITEGLSVARASSYAAIALFAQRAQAADPAFELSAENVSLVTEVCTKVDGMPLALELAAARLRTFGLRDLALFLNQRFSVLTRRSRSAEPRQQTLRALIDWSYNLIGTSEQRAFRRLSVFAGGFTADAAAALLNDMELNDITLLDLVGALVEKSLLVPYAPLSEAARYRYLETLREYALERLKESGEAEDVGGRFLSWCIDFVAGASADYETMRSSEWELKVGPELANLRAALVWAFADERDVARGQRLAAQARHIWGRLAPAEGRAWLNTAAARAGASTEPQLIAALELAQAHVGVALWEHEGALRHARRAEELYRDLGDQLCYLEARKFVGASTSPSSGVDNVAILADVLTSCQRLGEKPLLASTMAELGIACQGRGDLEKAATWYRRALSACEELGNEYGSLTALGNLAECEFQAGHTDEAVALVRRAIALDPKARITTMSLANESAYLVVLGQWEAALSSARRSVVLARSFHTGVDTLYAVQHIAAVLALRPTGEYHAMRCRLAARFIGYVDAALVAAGNIRGYTEQEEYERLMPLLRDTLGSGLNELLHEGALWTSSEATDRALRACDDDIGSSGNLQTEGTTTATR
ncbi:MAG: tetratricopeptide repeat protein [Candidatus Eremiobacteraeota bacterium]|nr:tetratricopeptide repeat protein [Candidatus Eremiobacteraeota bacterium]